MFAVVHGAVACDHPADLALVPATSRTLSGLLQSIGLCSLHALPVFKSCPLKMCCHETGHSSSPWALGKALRNDVHHGNHLAGRAGSLHQDMSGLSQFNR